MSINIPPEYTLGQQVDAWQKLHDAMQKAKRVEAAARLALCKLVVPTPVEGANSTPLPDGRIFAMTHKLNYKLDAEALPAVEKQLGKKLAKDLIRRKPELGVSAYRLLSAEQQLILSAALTVTPGMPDLEIRVPGKPKKGKKK